MMATTNAQTTNAQTTLNPNNIENWSGFSHQYNELGLNAHLESYSFKQELTRVAQKNYTENDVRRLRDRIQDLDTTLDINKQLIKTLMQQQGENSASEAGENAKV